MSGGPGGGPRRRQHQYPPQYHQHHQQPHHYHHHHHPPHQHHLQQQQQQQQQHFHQQHPQSHQQHQQQHQHQHQHPHMGPVYPGFMPYGPQGYYGIPPHFQNGAIQSHGYMQYQGYPRSPPAMQHYVPMAGVSVPPNYTRASQESPGLASNYQPPPVPAPISSHTPSSSHSSHMPPAPLTPPTPQTAEYSNAPTPVAAAVSMHPPLPPQPLHQSPLQQSEPFRPPLPWLSCPESSFPARTRRLRLQRKPLDADSAPVSLPLEQHGALPEHSTPTLARASDPSVASHPRSHQGGQIGSSRDDVSSQMTTAVNTQLGPAEKLEVKPSSGVSAGPHEPHPDSVHSTSLAPPQQNSMPSGDDKSDGPEKQAVAGDSDKPATNGAASSPTTQANGANGATDPSVSVPVKPAPSSWAGLFAKASPQPPVAKTTDGAATPNGSATSQTLAGSGSAFPNAVANSLTEAIRDYQVGRGSTISFLEPRGLINTGNMCYMNSVLQVLIFCVPFHDFLDQIRKKATHSFKSKTPLVDAMIMFMHEYKVLESAPSADLLQRKLKPEDLEKYGEPFTPEFVYEAIRQLARFASMRRGHQQDAEEFLGFLLQSLDDECTQMMGSSQPNETQNPSAGTAAVQAPAAEASGDWLEVGRKQRAAVTRSSGSNSSTPITKIFGGLLRSEFRVTGLKDSITTEPYQPLQLDIGSPDVRNVVDALRGLTRPERLQGDFNSPRGKDAVATKQVFIESLPPVLILHLKRFQFDAEGHGTIKIWKKVGYPLELEIPFEALSRQKRQTMAGGAMPRYRLISVVYHHGKNASGGHYTVDVRRQDGREWIRMDDTVIRRVRSEDVAEAGSEEDAKDGQKDASSTATGSANRFGAINDDDTGDEDGWKQVTASNGNSKRWSSVANGRGGQANAKEKQQQVKESIKDNKVAYLLFYQRV